MRKKKEKLPIQIHLIPIYEDEFSFVYRDKEIEDLVAEIILLGSGEPDEQKEEKIVRPSHATDQGEQQTHQK